MTCSKANGSPRPNRKPKRAQAAGRRHFLMTASALLAGTATRAWGGDPPHVNMPRATDGDHRFEPAWDEKLTIRVGPQKADLVGATERVIQAACDYVARLGGGTVRILPGTYTFRNSVYLPTGVRLIGSGSDSVLTKCPSVSVSIADDSDWYDQEITLADAKGFRVGDGVVLRARNPHNGSQEVIKRSLVARSGNRFKLSGGLRKNLWLSGKPTCNLLFPLLTSERTHDVTIENLTIDGNSAQNENLNGNYGGCIFLQDCSRYAIRDVETRNYNGDGISFQICHDIVVENCHSHDNTNLGLHPGSGSQRPIMRNNRLENNTIGLFWCWGVKFGLAEGNQIAGNRGYGISIGHNDTDNMMRDNTIRDSGRVGILFRDDARGKDFWPNRNVLIGNRIVNSGGPDGVAVDVQGRTRAIRLEGNHLEERRAPEQRVGIRIAEQAGSVALVDNRLQGFETPVVDLR